MRGSRPSHSFFLSDTRRLSHCSGGLPTACSASTCRRRCRGSDLAVDSLQPVRPRDARGGSRRVPPERARGEGEGGGGVERGLGGARAPLLRGRLAGEGAAGRARVPHRLPHREGTLRRQHLRLRAGLLLVRRDRKSTRLNSSHITISYAVFCLKKKK